MHDNFNKITLLPSFFCHISIPFFCIWISIFATLPSMTIVFANWALMLSFSSLALAMLSTTLVHLYLLRQSYHNVQLNITREHITNTSERELPYCRNSWWGLRRCRRSHILTGSEGGAWSWGAQSSLPRCLSRGPGGRRVGERSNFKKFPTHTQDHGDA